MLYFNEVKTKGISTPEMVINSLYNEVRRINDVDYYLLSNNVLVGSVDGYEVVVDGSADKLADQKFKTASISYDIQEKELDDKPIQELCDFLVSDDYYNSTYQYVLFITLLSGESKLLVGGVKYTIDAALSKINDEEPILDTKTLSIPVDASKGSESVMNDVKEYTSKFNVIAVFYFGPDVTLNEMIKAWTYEIPIINYSITGGEQCNDKILSMGVNIQTLWRATMELFDMKHIMIIYCNSVTSINSSNIVMSSAEENGIELDAEPFFLDENTEQNAQNACSEIKSWCEEGCYVINVLERSYYVNFFNAVKQWNITSDKFHIISYVLDEETLSMIDYEATNGHYVISFFFDSMITNVGEELRKEVRNESFYGKITSNMAQLYSSVFVMARSFNRARRTDELQAFLLYYLFIIIIILI